VPIAFDRRGNFACALSATRCAPTRCEARLGAQIVQSRCSVE